MLIQGNGFSYTLEDRLVKKLDLMIDRCIQKTPKRDAVLANEGGEGEGKTGSSICEAYYVKLKTKRDVHLFFRLEKLIEFAKATHDKIIIWDEPALDSMTEDRMKEVNRDLRRLLMTARIKRHFIIINWVKFWKFEEYIQVDRCLGMVHMYSRKQIEAGRFFYISKKNLEHLRNDYTQKKQRNYLKYKSFGGKFPDIMEEHFDKMDFWVEGMPHATYKLYDSEKNKAINSIGEDNNSKSKKYIQIERRMNGLKYLISRIKDIPKQKLCQLMQINRRTMIEWTKIDINSTDLLGKVGFRGDETDNIINTGDIVPQSYPNDSRTIVKQHSNNSPEPYLDEEEQLNQLITEPEEEKDEEGL